MPREANEGTCYQARLQPQVGLNIQGSIYNIVYKQQKYLNSPYGCPVLKIVVEKNHRWEGEIIDSTLALLSKIATSHADSGADVVGLSSMMDGQVKMHSFCS
jgi:Delta-aminolevulinic acid dehydratase